MYACMYAESGEVWVWGYGILGLGPKVNQCPIPQRIPPTLLGQNELQPDTKVVQIQAGMSHLAAVTNKGDLFMWGHNRGGLLGLGHDKDQYFPLRVAVGAPVKKVTLGIDHTMALCRDPI
ncbi:unnamed protein product [Darwinula stevensoni]|uniref:Uncharacterized protein n=1 Tax=Darwinula stevensoni TaxID=69355 RepID=A0A7R9FTI6_9CRUS|nr:unnamed protein product [Darwinula stevensoni]CAG0905435.1 unnamed protein product [Darwinula stevensoni]